LTGAALPTQLATGREILFDLRAAGHVPRSGLAKRGRGAIERGLNHVDELRKASRSPAATPGTRSSTSTRTAWPASVKSAGTRKSAHEGRCRGAPPTRRDRRQPAAAPGQCYWRCLQTPGADKHDSPITLTEDGADIVTIFHAVSPRYGPRNLRKRPSTCATRVFDRVDVIVGEHVWSFADFATGPAAFRVDGNKQGVFMRDRRPKARAHFSSVAGAPSRDRIAPSYRVI
jgi:hypothetical protein